MGRDAFWEKRLMKTGKHPDLQAILMLLHETLYIGRGTGKHAHVAGFLSTTLLARHQRFEACPALSFENSREGFRALLERINRYVLLTQVSALYVMRTPNGAERREDSTYCWK